MQIYIRVSPEADKDFAERFTREMRDQLMLGPYFSGFRLFIDEKMQEK